MISAWRSLWKRCTFVCLGFVLALPGYSAAVPEHELKLALTYKLAKFVSWPLEREQAATFRLCILGEDPFGPALDDLKSLRVKERVIAVEQIAIIDENSARCDLVFVSRSEAERITELLAELDGKPVLTISDLPRFAERGGIVELQNRDNRVGFEINVAAYKRAGLVVSSQLLQLATLIDEPKERSP